jgi:hypothetical protein
MGGSATQGFFRFDSGAGSRGDECWDVLDLTGDALPDLVVTGQNNNGFAEAFDGATAPYWRVYPGAATGFGPPLRWPVPLSGAPGASFGATTSFSSGATTRPSWTTLDMDADRRPDLLVLAQGDGTQSVVLGGPAMPTWHVYRNLGAPLAAAPAAPAVPATAWPTPFTGVLHLSTDPTLHGQPYALLDPLGRTVAAGTIAQGTQALDLGALPTGLYLLRLGQQPGRLKVVKE